MKFYIVVEHSSQLEKAQEISKIINAEISYETIYGCWNIILSSENIWLRSPNDKLSPITIDFESDSLIHRIKYGGGKNQAITKAVGVTSSKKPSIIDATAGLANDAFILASVGCHVTMYERNPILNILADFALEKAQRSKNELISEISSRIICIKGSISNSENIKSDVVYLDPMFPERNKSSKVKKEMQILKDLVGHDMDSDHLLPIAKNIAKNRVVVKRPKKSPFLGNEKPTYQMIGKSNRFDIYMVI